MLHLQQKYLCLLALWSDRGLSAWPSYSMLDRPKTIVLKVLVKSAHSKLHKQGAQGHTLMVNIVTSEEYLVYFTCRLAAV